ncbi:MAG: YcxB family protein [Phycisphaerales bacterium]|nr:YcxB family protein [Hyphomonadaceae bacterium]
MSATDPLVIKGVVLEDTERILRKSPWPAINRASGFQWAVTTGAPFVPIAFIATATNGSRGIIVITVLLLVLALLAIFLAAGRVWKTYAKLMLWTPTWGEAGDWQINSDGLSVDSHSLRMAAKWSAFVDVAENAEVFHFILSPAQVWALPKRAMSGDEIARLKSLIDEARARGDLKGVPD